MTPALRQEYGRYDIHAPHRVALTNWLRMQTGRRPKKHHSLGKAKSDLLQTRVGLKTLGLKRSRRALDEAPAWELLPECIYSKPGHPCLPPLFMEQLKCCQTAVEPDRCPLPGFFDLQWIESLRCFLCIKHNVLLSGERIWPHISRRHPGSFEKVTRSSVLTSFLGHIKKCYPTIVNQNPEALKQDLYALPERLSQPVSSIPVMRRYKCPVPDCKIWRAINTTKGALNTEYKKHVKSHSLSGAEYDAAMLIESQWTQKLTFDETMSDESFIIFVVPHDPVSDGPAFPMSTPAGIKGPAEQWSRDLGWDRELQRIANELAVPKEDAIARLRKLVELPAHDKVLQANGDIRKLVEMGLLRLNKLSMIYFSDAIGWMEQKHSSFRLLFGHEGFV